MGFKKFGHFFSWSLALVLSFNAYGGFKKFRLNGWTWTNFNANEWSRWTLKWSWICFVLDHSKPSQTIKAYIGLFLSYLDLHHLNWTYYGLAQTYLSSIRFNNAYIEFNPITYFKGKKNDHVLNYNFIVWKNPF